MGTEFELPGERVGRLGIWMAKCGGADGKQSCLNLGDVYFPSGLKDFCVLGFGKGEAKY